MKMIFFLFALELLFILLTENVHSQKTGKTIYECLFNPKTGWTDFVESSDTIKIYVSSSDGDDDLNDGLSESTPYKSFMKGYNALRNGYPDWLLFKRGDTWEETWTSWGKGGRGPCEPLVLKSYGKTGDPRPKFYFGGTVMNSWSEFNKHVAWTEITFSSEGGRAGGSVFRFLGPGEDLLMEDLEIIEMSSIFQAVDHTGDQYLKDIVFRRSLLYDNYPRSTGHAQGIYGSHVENFIFEEVLFYHNGWTQNQQYITNNGGVGGATIFNHNIYFNWKKNFILRNNLFLRGASMNMKCRNDDGSNPTMDLVVENNLFWGGELGIGLGGNTNEPYRFTYNRLTDNVFSDVGETIPENGGMSYTGRSLAFTVVLSDNSDTKFLGNIVMNGDYSGNGYGLKTANTQRNILIENNVMNRIKSSHLKLTNTEFEGTFEVINNKFQEMEYDTNYLIEYEDYVGKSVLFKGNKLFCNKSNRADCFSLKAGTDVEQWIIDTKTDFSYTKFPFPERTLQSYSDSLGFQPTVEAFIEEVKKQSRYNWREELTAAKVNDYFREAFGLKSTVQLLKEKAIKTYITIGVSLFIVIAILLLCIICAIGLCLYAKKKRKNDSFVNIASTEDVSSALEMGDTKSKVSY